MNWFWVILASLLGGVGNGLAGISAATVLVPVLIVLCPLFLGEAGAFQATTLALLCDILSSAITAAVHIRHGNIDLRRGWLMLVCVLSFSVAGSVVAWHVGGAVLGGFVLFLTLCIGIRYLVRPESSRQEPTIAQTPRMSAAAIAISLFFGSTIGFGTGFVGSGGGMMMFIVFTAFLHMSARKAVGTATLIMTGTATIAGITHLLMDPSPVTEYLPLTLAAIVVASLASLVSARFANRVPERTVGIVTGVVLTVLGASMIALRYGGVLLGLPLVSETLLYLARYLAFIIPFALALLVLRLVFPDIPRELFRKLLHLPAFLSGIVLMHATNDWRAATLASLVFALAIYPLLSLAERHPKYAALFVERRAGEIKHSLVELFGVVAALIAVCWGLLDMPYLAGTAILMWGPGDAAAALVGKSWGRHRTRIPLTDPAKTWEGTGAMALTALAFGLVTLLLVSGMPPLRCLVHALVGSFVAAAVELVSRRGHDTVTVPACVAATLWVCTLL